MEQTQNLPKVSETTTRYPRGVTCLPPDDDAEFIRHKRTSLVPELELNKESTFYEGNKSDKGTVFCPAPGSEDKFRKFVQANEGEVQIGNKHAFSNYLEKLSDTRTGGYFLIDRGYENDKKHNVHLLGEGKFGVASRCKNRTTGELFVKKKIAKQYFKKNEAIIPLQLDHENIVKIYGVKQVEERAKLYNELYLEYAGISLNQFIQQKFPLADDDVWSLSHQGFLALDYLHRHQIIHFDIKPDNICVLETENGMILKMIDFGSAKLSYQRLTYLHWTPEYMAPECCQYFLLVSEMGYFPITEKDLTVKVDVFSFGLTILFMVRNTHGYYGLTKDEKAESRLHLLWKMASDEDCIQKVLQRKLSNKDMLRLVDRLCCNRNNRLTSEEALNVIEEERSKRKPSVASDRPCLKKRRTKELDPREVQGGKKQRTSFSFYTETNQETSKTTLLLNQDSKKQEKIFIRAERSKRKPSVVSDRPCLKKRRTKELEPREVQGGKKQRTLFSYYTVTNQETSKTTLRLNQGSIKQENPVSAATTAEKHRGSSTALQQSVPDQNEMTIVKQNFVKSKLRARILSRQMKMQIIGSFESRSKVKLDLQDRNRPRRPVKEDGTDESMMQGNLPYLHKLL